jgi:hypothetical protein
MQRSPVARRFQKLSKRACLHTTAGPPWSLPVARVHVREWAFSRSDDNDVPLPPWRGPDVVVLRDCNTMANNSLGLVVDCLRGPSDCGLSGWNARRPSNMLRAEIWLVEQMTWHGGTCSRKPFAVPRSVLFTEQPHSLQPFSDNSRTRWYHSAQRRLVGMINVFVSLPHGGDSKSGCGVWKNT